jgi:hypothetical protein
MSIPFCVVLTIGSLLARPDPAKPLLTWYSPTERTELSGATLTNWVNKTANLLVNECGLTAGDTVTVSLPPHWQTAVVLLASWTVGLDIGAKGEVAFGQPGSGADFTLTLHPFEQSEWVLAVRAHGDHYSGPSVPVEVPAVPQDLKNGDRALFNVDSYPDPRDWLLAPLAAGASLVLCAGLGEAALAKTALAERTTWRAPDPQTR